MAAPKKKWEPLVGSLEEYLAGVVGSSVDAEGDDYDPKFREKVDAEKLRINQALDQKIQAENGDEKKRLMLLADELRDTKDQKKELEAKIKSLNVTIAAANELMVVALREAGMSGFKLANGGTCYTEIVPHTATEDPQRVRAWANETNPELLSVQWSTLNAENKRRIEEAMEAGEPVDEAVIPGTKVRVKTTVKFRK